MLSLLSPTDKSHHIIYEIRKTKGEARQNNGQNDLTISNSNKKKEIN